MFLGTAETIRYGTVSNVLVAKDDKEALENFKDSLDKDGFNTFGEDIRELREVNGYRIKLNKKH